MAQPRQEAALGRRGALGRVALDGHLGLHLLDGDVAHDAQDVGALALVAVHAACYLDAAHVTFGRGDAVANEAKDALRDGLVHLGAGFIAVVRVDVGAQLLAGEGDGVFAPAQQLRRTRVEVVAQRADVEVEAAQAGRCDGHVPALLLATQLHALAALAGVHAAVGQHVDDGDQGHRGEHQHVQQPFGGVRGAREVGQEDALFGEQLAVHVGDLARQGQTGRAVSLLGRQAAAAFGEQAQLSDEVVALDPGAQRRLEQPCVAEQVVEHHHRGDVRLVVAACQEALAGHMPLHGARFQCLAAALVADLGGQGRFKALHVGRVTRGDVGLQLGDGGGVGLRPEAFSANVGPDGAQQVHAGDGQQPDQRERPDGHDLPHQGCLLGEGGGAPLEVIAGWRAPREIALAGQTRHPGKPDVV